MGKETTPHGHSAAHISDGQKGKLASTRVNVLSAHELHNGKVIPVYTKHFVTHLRLKFGVTQWSNKPKTGVRINSCQISSINIDSKTIQWLIFIAYVKTSRLCMKAGSQRWVFYNSFFSVFAEGAKALRGRTEKGCFHWILRQKYLAFRRGMASVTKRPTS